MSIINSFCVHYSIFNDIYVCPSSLLKYSFIQLVDTFYFKYIQICKSQKKYKLMTKNYI